VKRSVFLVVILGVLAMALPAADMTGLITCSKCRHTEQSGMDCATTCLRNGVPAVFYEQTTQKFYNVANQGAVKAHFGTRVVVSGTVSGENLTVSSIKPAPPAKSQ
jgi:hypothetical protein